MRTCPGGRQTCGKQLFAGSSEYGEVGFAHSLTWATCQAGYDHGATTGPCVSWSLDHVRSLQLHQVTTCSFWACR